MTKKRNRVFVALAILLLAGAAGARTTDSDRPIVAGEIGEDLDAVVRRAGGPEFWGAVLVAREGRVLLAKGYGLADYESAPNTPRTLFELASVSKQVTAVAILHLEQRGKLKTSDTLDRFFPGVPEEKRVITLHHLLTHTSGIPDSAGVAYRSTIPRRAYAAHVLAAPLEFTPGEKFSYSNPGYALLAAVVEDVTGADFEEYVERHLFTKAKMKDSGFVGDRDLKKTGRASVRRNGEPGTWTAADWAWGWGYKGMGGVVTTVLDVNRWDRALRGKAILREEAREKMYTPLRSGYACGWYVDVTDRGTRRAHHTGSVGGYGTRLLRYLEDDAVIVVLSNHGKPAWEVSEALEKALFAPVPIGLEVRRGGFDPDASGVVHLPSGAEWTARVRGGTLTLGLRVGRKVPAEIRGPEGWGLGLLSKIENILSAQPERSGASASTEAVLCLGRYGTPTRLELERDLSIRLEPGNRGRPPADPNVEPSWYLHVVHAERNASPLYVKLNAGGLASLAATLREALGE